METAISCAIVVIATLVIVSQLRGLRSEVSAFRAELREASFAWYSDHSESRIRPYGHDILRMLEVIAENTQAKPEEAL